MVPGYERLDRGLACADHAGTDVRDDQHVVVREVHGAQVCRVGRQRDRETECRESRDFIANVRAEPENSARLDANEGRWRYLMSDLRVPTARTIGRERGRSGNA